MKRERERLAKVENEAQLRPGMLVVLKACRLCQGTHRSMLLRRFPDGTGCGSDGKPSRSVWANVPLDPCRQNARGTRIDRALRDGRLYRVVDGLDLAKEAQRDRELEKVR